MLQCVTTYKAVEEAKSCWPMIFNGKYNGLVSEKITSRGGADPKVENSIFNPSFTNVSKLKMKKTWIGQMMHQIVVFNHISLFTKFEPNPLAHIDLLLAGYILHGACWMVIGQCVNGFGSIKDNHIYEIGKRTLVSICLALGNHFY